MIKSHKEFVAHFESEVQKTLSERAMSIASGSVPNMESYHRKVGVNEGLVLAVNMAKGLLNAMRDLEESQAGQLQDMPDADTGKNRKKAQKVV